MRSSTLRTPVLVTVGSSWANTTRETFDRVLLYRHWDKTLQEVTKDSITTGQRKTKTFCCQRFTGKTEEMGNEDHIGSHRNRIWILGEQALEDVGQDYQNLEGFDFFVPQGY